MNPPVQRQSIGSTWFVGVVDCFSQSVSLLEISEGISPTQIKQREENAPLAFWMLPHFGWLFIS